MPKAAGGGASIQSGDRSDDHHSIVSELVSLIAHVRASMKRIEAAIASETAAGDQEVAANVLVLDDVTPRYLKANAALHSCNADLAAALRLLRDAVPLRSTVDHNPARLQDAQGRSQMPMSVS